MPFQAKMQLEKDDTNEIVVLSADYEFVQPVDSQNHPKGIPKAKVLRVIIESSKDNRVIEWMVSPTMTKSIKITFYGDNGSVIRTIEMKDAYCLGYKETFDHNDSQPFKAVIRLAALDVKADGKAATEDNTAITNFVADEPEESKGADENMEAEKVEDGKRSEGDIPATGLTADNASIPKLQAKNTGLLQNIENTIASNTLDINKKIDDLIKNTQAEAQRLLTEFERQKELPIKQRTLTKQDLGPCLSGIYDPLTGKTAYGRNFPTTANGYKDYEDWLTKPASEGGADDYIKELNRTYTEKVSSGEVKLSEVADTRYVGHSEMRALDEIIKERRAKGIPVDESIMSSLYLRNLDLRKSDENNLPLTKPRCENCSYLTKGINLIGHN